MRNRCLLSFVMAFWKSWDMSVLGNAKPRMETAEFCLPPSSQHMEAGKLMVQHAVHFVRDYVLHLGHLPTNAYMLDC